jgi:ABC-type polysaccharide/polyol phosphate transport system ATPase subunit
MSNCIELDNVSVEIPVFDASRSFRRSIASRLGGEIHRNQQQHVSVVALKDISFALQPGDRVGLVGHNGAGKTTLLRLLGQIYRPTSGVYRCRGKLTSLFNINLGMDLDDTGIENIGTMGMFLGMTRQEIADKQDEIIAFSDLGDFIHLPLRTYSSGMLTRLSFALATALQPDILLMDEGIGAGDADFADKAEKRLSKFYGGIGTLVLASHSNALIKQLCNKAMMLKHGRIEAFGSVDEVLAIYQGA